MRERRCPVCGADRSANLFAEANYDSAKLDAFAYASRKTPEQMHLRLVRCDACDLIYATPVPAADALAAAYEAAAFDSGEESARAARTCIAHVLRAARKLPDRIGALDIGAGDGAFLERLLENGFTGVAGVEPSDAPIRAAKENIRPLIRKGIFYESAFQPKSFSLITCFQTMEHLSEPAAVCAAAFRLLKPGGALALVCHNHRAFSAKLLGMKSPIFDIEHLQLFSPRGVTRLLEGAGFKEVDVRTVINTYPAHYWIKLLPLPAKAQLIAVLKATGIGHIPVPLPAGNLFAVGFKK
ncbi:MAG: class I SAM-dependent methyltransferase [Nitrospinae bacterium]|nr:class I SAM-dependent methyltransferase [Nitrospinota bacterium]